MTNYMDNYLNWLESTTPEERLAAGRDAVKASTARSPELARWLALHGLRDCICTYLPTGKAGWYLYRIADGCRHPEGDGTS